MHMLSAREARRENISKLLNEYEVIVSLKTVVPGEEKNLPECKRVMYVMNKELVDKLPFHRFRVFESVDGDYVLYLLNQVEAIDIKKITVFLEETHPLGRYVDIDVYTMESSLTRQKLGYPNRKCVICDEDAFVCMRKQNHTAEALITHLKNLIKEYFESTLQSALEKAFFHELNLHPKFGLVTPYSSGSHTDMNYEIMKTSYQVIIPYLLQMYEVGYHAKDVDQGFQKIRQVGLDAEKAMLKASHGVNTYKGAIFLVGILVYALGYFHQTIEGDIREIIKYFSRNILKELKDDPNTFGIEAYQKHNVYTVRHEAYYGLPSVIKAYHSLIKHRRFSDQALMMTLIDIISNKNDTVGLKRSKSFSKYFEMANKIEKIKTYDLERIEKITNECIEENISFGGSADVLIATILLYYLKENNLL